MSSAGAIDKTPVYFDVLLHHTDDDDDDDDDDNDDVAKSVVIKMSVG